MRAIFLLTILSIVRMNVFAQEPNIENYLSLIQRGEAAYVQAELPSLLKQYPNNPGVQYVQGVMTTDGAEAVRIYQTIVDNYPKSEWADDALFKVYKFYHAIGLHRTAEIKLNQLKTAYPESKYLTGDDTTAITPAAEQKSEPSPPLTSQQPQIQTIETPIAEEPPKRIVAKSSDGTKEETLKSEAPKVETPKHELATGSFTLQVGVFSTPANAKKQKSFFEYQQYSAEIVSKAKGSRDLFYVYVGSYATADEAKAHGDEIKRSFNIDFFVVTR
jgi:cell division septation protein DedD